MNYKDGGNYIGTVVKVKKPLLISLEKISPNEFLYLMSFAGKQGEIVAVYEGRGDKLIFEIKIFDKEQRYAFVHEDDLLIVKKNSYGRKYVWRKWNC